MTARPTSAGLDARHAFAALALPHLDAAYRLARHLTRDPAAAEDVVQEAMLRALTYFASFRGGDARAWLLRIVRNAAYDTMNARNSAAHREESAEDALDALPDPGDGPEASLARKQSGERLEQALAALPLPLRECLVLREIEELSYKEIVEITGVPIGTVMSRLFRARRMLVASCRPQSP